MVNPPESSELEKVNSDNFYAGMKDDFGEFDGDSYYLLGVDFNGRASECGMLLASLDNLDLNVNPLIVFKKEVDGLKKFRRDNHGAFEEEILKGIDKVVNHFCESMEKYDIERRIKVSDMSNEEFHEAVDEKRFAIYN